VDDDSAAGGPPHEVLLCGRCRELGHPCWYKNRR
jgi:hypothetical protein